MPPADPVSPVPSPTDREGSGGSKVAITAIAVTLVLALDIVTKQWIVNTMPLYSQKSVWGNFFRLTYTHNRGAAFGIDIGEHSRIFFLVLSGIALCVLFVIYRSTPAWDRLRVLALSLVAGGAVTMQWRGSTT